MSATIARPSLAVDTKLASHLDIPEMRTQASEGARAAVRALTALKSSATSASSRATPSSAGPLFCQAVSRKSTLPLPLLAGRSFSSSSITAAAPPSSSRPPTGAGGAPPPKGPIRDEAILEKSSFVRLVDPKSGALAGPFNTKQILSKLDRTKFWIQQVVPPQPDRATIEYDPSAPPAKVDPAALVQFPICKLIDKKEEFDKQRALKRKSSPSPTESSASGAGSAAGTSKEVQLTWSVTSNDLAHKLSKAKREMIKGARINVVVTTKTGGKKYIKGFNVKEDERREDLLQQIEAFLCTASDKGEASSGNADPGAGEPQTQQPIARRLQDVDWQRGGSAAVMSFECFKTK